MGPDSHTLYHFWIPLAATALAVALLMARDKSRRLAGKLLSAVILLALILQSQPLNTSLEGWTLHLLLVMLGPMFCIVVGSLLALFGGPTPVGPIPRGWRPVGFALIAIGLGWFLWMIFAARPTLDGIDNPWWLHFSASLLTTLVIASGFASAFSLVMGDERYFESALMLLLSIGSFGLLIWLLAQGAGGDDPVFWRAASSGALGDLFGMLVGGGGAVLMFVLVVWWGEKNQPHVLPVEPLSTTEQTRVKEILVDNIRQEDES